MFGDQCDDTVEIWDIDGRGDAPREFEGAPDSGPQAEFQVGLEPESRPQDVLTSAIAFRGPRRSHLRMTQEVGRNQAESVAIGLGIRPELVAEVGQGQIPSSELRPRGYVAFDESHSMTRR